MLGTTIAESTPSFEPRPTAPPGAPNVVVIVLDDLGFAQLGCFGSDIATPAIDGLAAGGLRYNRFHVTSLCSPTRACLLTGRNHHAVGMGFLTDIPIGFPGYNGRIPPSAATLPRILRDNGYSTFAVGKWHLAPRWEQSRVGPVRPLAARARLRALLRLPRRRHQPVDARAGARQRLRRAAAPARGRLPPHRGPGRPGASASIQDQQQATPGKPFFLYFATGAMHAPHHAPPRVDRAATAARSTTAGRRGATRAFARQVGRGRRARRAPRCPSARRGCRSGTRCRADERRLFARMMEVFAGFLTHTDAQIGRLRRLPRDDRRARRHAGAAASPTTAPAPRAARSARSTSTASPTTSSDDIADTLGAHRRARRLPRLQPLPVGLGVGRQHAAAAVEALHVARRRAHAARSCTGRNGIAGARRGAVAVLPRRRPDADGARRRRHRRARASSTASSSSPSTARACSRPSPTPARPTPRRTQYFEMLGSRAIYHDGWKATTDHVGTQLTVEQRAARGQPRLRRRPLGAVRPRRTTSPSRTTSPPSTPSGCAAHRAAVVGRGRAQPGAARSTTRSSAGRSRWSRRPTRPRHRTVYRPGGGAVAEDVLPPHRRRLPAAPPTSSVPDGGADGRRCAPSATGTTAGRWYLLDGRPVTRVQPVRRTPHRVAAGEPVGPGDHELGLTLPPTGGGLDARSSTARRSATAPLPEHLPFRWQIGGGRLLVGHDRGFPVCDDYEPPFPFTGELRTITFEIPMFAPHDPADQIATALRSE